MMRSSVFLIMTAIALGLQCEGMRTRRTPTPTSASEYHDYEHRKWQPAVYLGLKVGKATRADMLRILGEPVWSGTPEGSTPGDPRAEIWYDYNRGGEFPGKLTVVTEAPTGRILAIDLHPEMLSKEEAIAHLGEDYVITRYDFDDCLGDSLSAPVYESPEGPLLSIEYRARGIAVAIDWEGRVQRISYVSQPLGAVSTQCKPHPVKWRAGVYKGLTIDKSTVADMRRVLGEPQRSTPLGDGKGRVPKRQVAFDYRDFSEIPSKFIVIADGPAGKIKRIDVFPEALGADEVKRRFGQGHRTTRTLDGDCLQYRKLGITISIESDGKVAAIHFVGPDSGYAPCKTTW